ncbi:MAG: hypothetical protein HKP41_13240 [Desulfobacterales bacterium]|nr:hypothetical protein [Deltaproteobacteria bacterium]MBT8362534.1 hypothetical protein [Deltaproteobacteria bacterium]NNK95309.1 hypothetical protein [Desulfobacterales bacterium]
MANNVHKSVIPFHVTRSKAFISLFIFLALDVFFVIVYLISTLPEVKNLTLGHQLASLDLDIEANLPTNYAILKLYGTAIISILMVFWYKKKSPVFWKIAACVLFIIGLDESAQLHELWAAAVAPKLFGTDYLVGNQFTIVPYAIILGSLYLSSLTLFPWKSRIVFVCFVLSGISLILSQSAEWSFGPAMTAMDSTFEFFAPLLEHFDKDTLMFAWEEGLEMVGYSLLCGGVIIGVHSIQKLKAEI